MTMNCVRYSTLALIATLLGGCAIQATGFVNDKSVSVRAATTEAVVAEDGKCTATISIDPALFRNKPDEGLLGMTECEIVAIKGTPLSVQTGSSSTSRRETTMLYMEPTGKAVFLFSDNRLIKIVR
ncbi:hypothetical protein KIH24_06465 [Rhizobiales bacterium TNE-4]|nr:hypothetical protein [Rhizobiales bacterium TNE-4]MBV1827265.1 hypothetical protein [Rhizobiales bacterium TNE-4]